MRKIFRYTVFVFIIVLVGIQFVPVSKTNPAVEAEIAAPQPVQAILERACYDCHSNETVWPWYSNIAPISWRVAGHVNHGREEMNFSDWQAYSVKKQKKLKDEIYEESAKGKMPLKDFLILHKEARLSEQDIDVLGDWALANPPRGIAADD